MKQNIYKQRALFLLLPLGLLAIIAFAFDRRIPTGLNYNLQAILLTLSRNVLPGFFAIAVACLIPCINRFYQLIAIGFNYVLISSVCITFYPTLFPQPTPWVVASLSAALFLLPNSDAEAEVDTLKFGSLLRKALGIIITPSLMLLIFVVLVRNIEHSIVITFTSVFVDSMLACIYVPIYEVMLTLGFSPLLNNLASMQSESMTTNAILNSVILVNMFSFPAVIFAKAAFEDGFSRLFLLFLALITCITAKNGTCISLELAIILMFYQGTMLVLILSSIFVFFVCLYLQIPALTGFEQLYIPDMIFRNMALMNMHVHDFSAIFFAIAIPVVFQSVLSKISMINYLRVKFKYRNQTAGFKLNQIDSPELLLIGLLKNLGGRSNLQSVMMIGEDLYIKVKDFSKISQHGLLVLGKRRVGFLRSKNEIRLSLKQDANIIELRIRNIIANELNYISDDNEVAKEFNISQYVHSLKEKTGDTK